jgi:hypothetical protein
MSKPPRRLTYWQVIRRDRTLERSYRILGNQRQLFSALQDILGSPLSSDEWTDAALVMRSDIAREIFLNCQYIIAVTDGRVDPPSEEVESELPF